MGVRPRYPALTAASPSAQALISGTTSTNVVFAPASGGSGVYTYGAPSTSAGTVSGTAPGTVTLSGLSDGSVAVVSVLVTDTRTGQAITQRCTVSVAASASLDWTTVLERDFTALDAGQSWTAPATPALTFSDSQDDLAVTVGHQTGTEDLLVQSSPGSGLLIRSTSATGTVRAAHVAIPLPAGISAADFARGVVEVQVVLTGLTCTASNQDSWSVHVVPGTTISVNVNGRASWAFVDAASDNAAVGRYSGTGQTSAGSHALNRANPVRAAIRVYPGGGADLAFDQSTGAGYCSVSDASPSGRGWSSGYTSGPTVAGNEPFSSGGYIVLYVNAGSAAGSTVSMILKRLRVVKSTRAASVP